MSERVNAVTEGSMVQNERGGRTADCAMPIRHTMLTVLRNLGWAALVSQGVPLLLRSIRLLDSGSAITLYIVDYAKMFRCYITPCIYENF